MCINEDVNAFPTLDVFFEKLKEHFGDVNTPENMFLKMVRETQITSNVAKYNVEFANSMALSLKVTITCYSFDVRIPKKSMRSSTNSVYRTSCEIRLTYNALVIETSESKP